MILIVHGFPSDIAALRVGYECHVHAQIRHKGLIPVLKCPAILLLSL